ncbi:hypothetical protein PUN28_006038 [Cardiocondyla obscurior]|uniref:Uncharacterized protein n=1 Tax=Cardiocondyla obscurior TaxID=286306 RepID=A0AAW2G6R7_9HYME
MPRRDLDFAPGNALQPGRSPLPSASPSKGGNENHPFTLPERLIETTDVATCKPSRLQIRFRFAFAASPELLRSPRRAYTIHERKQERGERERSGPDSLKVLCAAPAKSFLRALPAQSRPGAKGRKRKGHEKEQGKKNFAYLPIYLPTYLPTRRGRARALKSSSACS